MQRGNGQGPGEEPTVSEQLPPDVQPPKPHPLSALHKPQAHDWPALLDVWQPGWG